MVDYSSQKPIQNPSYFKKPATKSQLTAGGQGGKGAALAANVNGASGQANQSVPGEDFLSGMSKKLGFVPNAPISTQGMNTGTSQPGILSIEGGTTALANVANRTFGSKEVQAQPISASSLLNQPGTNQYKQVSTTPIAIQQLATKPLAQPIQKPTLGQFTTPTGGFAKIAITPNQPVNTQGIGLHQLTPDQQSYLQGQIDRNARPEVQAEFAKQAAIADKRIAEGKAWDTAHSPDSPENRASQSRNLFLGAMRDNNLAGIQEYGDLYKKEAGLAGDIAQNRLTAGSAASIEAQRLGQTAEIKGTEQSIEAQKHNDTVTQNYANWATNPSEGGMAHPATKLATAVQLGIKPDPALIFGGDKVNEFAQITDPAEKQSWLINELGPEGATQWINLHKSR